jgi:hypothetical protein
MNLRLENCRTLRCLKIMYRSPVSYFQYSRDEASLIPWASSEERMSFRRLTLTLMGMGLTFHPYYDFLCFTNSVSLGRMVSTLPTTP